jgi:deoxyhypusine synthase
MASAPGAVPAAAAAAVLVESEQMPEGTATVIGYDFEGAVASGAGVDFDALLASYATTGFQATNFAAAVDRINEMLRWRLSDEPIAEDESADYRDPEVRQNTKCKIFLGYTSNMASAGVREAIRFLVQNKLVDVVVSTGGGIEEDFIKCMQPTYMGDFALPGKDLRKKGINRIGNLLVPNKNYCDFEDWIMPILDACLDEQLADPENVRWTPSKLIHRLGKEINDERSIYYWCWKNNIPVYSPAITDGSIGDMLYFHSFKRPGLVVDLVEDIRGMNGEAVYAKKTGMIIVGGGLIKHHICNANLMRNGADYAVFLNTAQEFDGSDSGARPDEAVSWGKIRLDARPVKIYAEATLIFPLLVARTFAKYEMERRAAEKAEKAEK